MSSWTTASGKVLVWEELELQHLSNIFWYHKIIFPNVTTRLKALDQIDLRFKGPGQITNDVILPYVPVFDWEVIELNRMRLIIGNDIHERIGGAVIGHLPIIKEDTLESVVREIRKEISQEIISIRSSL